MPYAKNGDISIYYEIEGEGEPLVLHHMYPRDLESWKSAGYVDALKGHYRVVLMDARGHGKSDRDPDPKGYEAASRAADIVAVMDAAGVEKATYWGYSLGGRAGWPLAAYHPDRLTALIIGGADPNPAPGYLSRPLERLLQSTEQYSRGLAACLTGLMTDAPWQDSLSKIAVPCLLYSGEADGVFQAMKDASGVIKNATFFSLPELNHGQGFERSDLVLARVTEFLQSKVLAH